MIENFDEIMTDFKNRLEGKIDRLKYEFSIIHAGRVNARMLDKVMVNYYGTPTPLTQMANIAVPEGRLIVISPWDISVIKEVNKAILSSDLGVNPTDDGRVIRLAFPSVTEEKRREIVKDVKKISEEFRIGVRTERKDFIEKFRNFEKEKKMSEDELKFATDEVQKLVDKFNGIIDSLTEKKEKEVLEV